MQKFKFSIWNMLCPSRSIKSIGYLYTQAKNNLFEYLELKNLISRLQDVDKLKSILLNDYQRKLFDSIPKPTCLGSAKRGSAHLNLENFKKKSIMKTELKDLLALAPPEKDDLTKNILNLIDPMISKINIRTFFCFVTLKRFEQKSNQTLVLFQKVQWTFLLLIRVINEIFRVIWFLSRFV